MNNKAEAHVAFFNALATFAAFALLVLLVGGPLALALGVDLCPNQRWALLQWEVGFGLGVVAIVAIAYFCVSHRRFRFPESAEARAKAEKRGLGDNAQAPHEP